MKKPLKPLIFLCIIFDMEVYLLYLDTLRPRAEEAMALPALRALRGELKPHVYSGRDVWQGFGDIGL